jgi:hypothetical protein
VLLLTLPVEHALVPDVRQPLDAVAGDVSEPLPSPEVSGA